jgi:hypothetical protein
MPQPSLTTHVLALARATVRLPLWSPPFDDLRPMYVSIYGKPLSTIVSRPGAVVKLNPIRWFNGHPGAHTVSWHAEPKGALEWTHSLYGVKHCVVYGAATVWAEARTPDGRVFETQKVRIVMAFDQTGERLG